MNNAGLNNNLLPSVGNGGATRVSSSRGESSNVADFAGVLAGDIAATKKLSQLKDPLSASDLDRLKDFLTGGKGLPLAAEIAAGEVSPETLALLQNTLSTEQIEAITGINTLSQVASEQGSAVNSSESDAPLDALALLQWVLHAEQGSASQGINALSASAASDNRRGPGGELIAGELRGKFWQLAIQNKAVGGPISESANTTQGLVAKTFGQGTELSFSPGGAINQPTSDPSALFKNMLATTNQPSQPNSLMTPAQAALPGMVSSMDLQPFGKGQAVSPSPINIPVGEKGWDNLLGNRIMWMMGKEVQTATVKLTPGHLGPIELHVSVKNDQASVSFLAQNAVAKEALEAAVPRLREMFSETNMQLVNVDVGHRNAQQERASGFFQQSDSNDENNGQLMGQDNPDDAENPEKEALSTGLGLVDDYA